MVLCAILLVSLSSLVTYIIVKSQLKNQSPVSSSTPVVKVSPTPTVVADPDAGWKTYTNTKYGFTIKHPYTWGPEDSGQGVVTLKNDRLGQIVIYEGVLSGGTNNPKARFEYSETQLDNKEAKMQKYYFNNQLKQINYEIQINSKSLVISLQPNPNSSFDLFDQILSTFKFLD